MVKGTPSFITPWRPTIRAPISSGHLLTPNPSFRRNHLLALLPPRRRPSIRTLSSKEASQPQIEDPLNARAPESGLDWTRSHPARTPHPPPTTRCASLACPATLASRLSSSADGHSLRPNDHLSFHTTQTGASHHLSTLSRWRIARRASFGHTLSPITASIYLRARWANLATATQLAFPRSPWNSLTGSDTIGTRLKMLACSASSAQRLVLSCG